MKWSLIIFSFTILACSVNRDLRDKTKTNTIRINSLDLNLKSHFKNGNYIISITDSIQNDLIEKFTYLQDSSAFKNDTINLEVLNGYWTRSPIKRILRNYIEMNNVRIYSIKESKYLYKVKRTVSKLKIKKIHNSYLYTNSLNGDTILYSYSFDIGCPPF